MRVINPIDTSHSIKIIPRYYGYIDAVLTLSNLAKSVIDVVSFTEILKNGVVEIFFDYTFLEGDKFTIKLMEGSEVVFRGNLFATVQGAQNYNVSKNYYSYG